MMDHNSSKEYPPEDLGVLCDRECGLPELFDQQVEQASSPCSLVDRRGYSAVFSCARPVYSKHATEVEPREH